MIEFEFEKRLQVDNFVWQLTKDSEYLIVSTVPTEQNLGGVLLGMYQPMTDKQLYAHIRSIFDMAVDGDENAKTMLMMYSMLQFAVRSVFPVDPTLLNDVMRDLKECYGRIENILKAYGEDETEEEALAELAEREEIENRLREYNNVVNDGKNK